MPSPDFSSAERARLMEHYFRDDVRDFVQSEVRLGES